MFDILFMLLVPTLVMSALGKLLQRYSRARRRRQLLDVPRARLADAGVLAADETRLTGEVVPLELLVAPLTGRACVYYAVWVHAFERGMWFAWTCDVRGAPFLLRDASGDALIDPRDADVGLEPVVTERTPIAAASEYVRALVAARGIIDAAVWPDPADPRRTRFVGADVRCTEIAIPRGATVAVIGRPVRDLDPHSAGRAGGYRDLPPMRAYLSATRGSPLAITDDRVVVADGAKLALRPAGGA